MIEVKPLTTTYIIGGPVESDWRIWTEHQESKEKPRQPFEVGEPCVLPHESRGRILRLDCLQHWKWNCLWHGCSFGIYSWVLNGLNSIYLWAVQTIYMFWILQKTLSVPFSQVKNKIDLFSLWLVIQFKLYQLYLYLYLIPSLNGINDELISL